ncbi:hypothetical protein [Thermomonospora umbrina]|uniref:Small secreted domain DUF320 n=1 Tax=Thermomonospora umbrina TaxID=111806 RepID=A0A3D9SPW6_9ACTN|nr:hypothetical protein [Thermomonospora umbrina]REE97948.1 hypothetical protein DFJ69_3428 [Thermomonospora umbrina]
MIKKLAATGVLAFATAGIIGAAAVPASANGIEGQGGDGVLNGNVVSVPIDVCNVNVLAIVLGQKCGWDNNDNGNGHGKNGPKGGPKGGPKSGGGQY